MLRFAAHLPDAAVGFAPVLDGLLDLLLEHRPQRLGDLLARLGVQVHRVQHRAPDVVLHLVVGAVADAHRAGVVVAGQVVQLLFDQAAFAADAVHHLQRMAFTVVGARHVGDEREEVVGLAVQAQRVQAPQRERRVAHPGVAVVPVAFALRGFRQRRGAGRQQRTGRRVGQALQRQRAALQIRPPRVIREVADVDPLPPALAGLSTSCRRLRRRSAAPGAWTSSARRTRCRPRSAGCGRGPRGPPARCAGWWSAAASGARRGSRLARAIGLAVRLWPSTPRWRRMRW